MVVLKMVDYFKEQKQEIQEILIQYLQGKQEMLSKVNNWGGDLIDRVIPFCCQGKMIRGGLVILSTSMFDANLLHDAKRLAGAIELFHTSLLIHDDIMDEDFIRRGGKTIFAQYKEWGESTNITRPLDLGKNMGTCAGDIVFFLAYEMLSGLDIDPITRGKIIRLCSQELVNVGLAQMQDLFLGYSDNSVSEEEILNLYKYKTARYTFSLPLMLGSLLTLQGLETQKELEELGHVLGIIYQIKDDEIGLFGEEETIGKPTGSDIEEGKKTLFHYYLYRTCTAKDKKRLNTIYGAGQITPPMLETVRSLVISTGVKEIIDKKIETMKGECIALIENLNIEGYYRDLLLELLEYNINRRQ